MKRSQRNCLTATLLMGMMFLAAIFTLQGALLTSLIAHYSVTESVQGFASSAASMGGVLALVSSFFLIGKLSKFLLLRLAVAACAVFLALLKLSPTFAVFTAMWFALGIGMGYLDMLVSSCMADLYEGRAATRMMCIGILASGVCFGAFIPCTLDVGCALTPESSMFATTSMMLAVYLGQAVAPPVIGVLGAAFSLHAGIIFCIAFTFLCSLFCSFAKLPGDIR